MTRRQSNELASIAIRDPFRMPVRLVGFDAVARTAAIRLFGAEPDGTLVLAMPIDQPKNVLDATPGTCAACGLGVWVSPSTRTVADAVLVCVPCFTGDGEVPRG